MPGKSPYRVLLVTDHNGERVPFLLDKRSGIPLTEVNQWRLLARRGRCQHATLKREMLEISFLYRWAFDRGIDLQVRMNSGEGIRTSETTDLADYLRQNFTENIQNSRVPRHVGRVVQQQRFATIRIFLTWWMDIVLERIPQDRKESHLRFVRIKEHRDRMLRWLDPPSGKSSSREGLTPTLRKRFLQVIHPDSPENPWNRNSRLRNYVMFALYIWLGPRLSELLLLKCHHVNLDRRRSTLLIERAPDDPEDPRADAPEAKTLGRELPIPDSLVRYLREYMRTVRPHIGAAKMHPFLFVAYPDGAPLSKRAVQHLLEQLRSRHPEFNEVLTVHVLRNCWADMMRARLREMVRNKEIDSEFAKLLFNYLGGWTHGSFQSDKYSSGEIRRTADEALISIHDEIFDVATL